MNDRIKQFAQQAMMKVEVRPGTGACNMNDFEQAFAELIVMDCIATIQLHMPRNGVRSPENVISRQHVNNIADLYGIALPLPNSVYEQQIANIMAGADQMEGDGGYREVSLKTPEFLEIQARHHALYSKAPITAEAVQHLRHMTDCTMMDCKKALTACSGNMDEAIEYLRKGRQYRSSV